MKVIAISTIDPSYPALKEVLQEKDNKPLVKNTGVHDLLTKFIQVSNSYTHLRYFEVREFTQWLNKVKLQYFSSSYRGTWSIKLAEKDNLFALEDEECKEAFKDNPRLKNLQVYEMHTLLRVREGLPEFLYIVPMFTTEELKSTDLCIRKQESLCVYLRHQYEHHAYYYAIGESNNNYDRWLTEEELSNLVDFMDN